jgi:hypothetical protein
LSDIESRFGGRESLVEGSLYLNRVCCENSKDAVNSTVFRELRGIERMETTSPFKWRHFQTEMMLLCVLVRELSTELARFRGDDARAGIARRSHDDLPLSCNITRLNGGIVADPISKQRTTRDASMKRT